MTEQRRMDDQLGPDGEPLSEAHKAIYAHISECRDEMIRENKRLHDEHVERHHHPPLAKIASDIGKTPTQLMSDFIESVEVSRRVVEALDGPSKTRIDGSVYHKEEDGIIFQVKDIQAQLHNGVKHKVEISKLQYGLAGTAVTALTGIAVALIANL